MFRDKSYNSIIMLSLNIIMFIIKINNKSNTPLMAYLGLEPKFSHTIKYSQPFELVLFHVTIININCHKGFYYPHVLNNYLFNYLNSQVL